MALANSVVQRENDKFKEVGSETVVKTAVYNSSGDAVSPATSAKQDDIISNLGALEASEYIYILKEDSVTSGIFYKCWAAQGSDQGDPVWRIQKMDTVNYDLAKTWADGDTNFDNVYDDRESLTYSYGA